MMKGTTCWCGTLLGVLVIVFAWWHVAWAPIALTIAGAVIVLKEATGLCCCGKKGEAGTGRCH
jgi:hypothetical protein